MISVLRREGEKRHTQVAVCRQRPKGVEDCLQPLAARRVVEPTGRN